MKAQEWKKLDVSKIDSVQSSASGFSEQTKLFNDIKELIKQATITLYGTAATEDKYVKIVQLIMTRVSKQLQKLDISDDSILEKIETAIDKYLKEKNIKISSDNSELNDSEDSNTTENNKTDTENNTQTDANDDSIQTIKELADTVETVIDDNSKQDINKEENNDKEKTNTSSIDNIQNLLQLVNDNILKLEKTIQDSYKSFKNPKALTNKQFNNFSSLVDRNFTDLSQLIIKNTIDINDNLYKIYEKQLIFIKMLQKHMEKPSLIKTILKWLVIGFVVFGIIFAVFKDKITAWIKKKFNIDENKSITEVLKEKVDKLINNYLSEDFLLGVFDFLYEVITEHVKSLIVDEWNKFISDPISYVTKYIQSILDDVINFGKDIWQWVTGAEKESKEEQEKIIEKIKSDSDADAKKQLDEAQEKENKMFAALEKELCEKLDEQNKQFQNTTTQAAVVANDTSKQVDENLKSTVTDITKTTNNAVNDVKQKTDSSVNSTNNEVKKFEKSTNDNITASTKSLNQNAKDITDEIAKDGAQKPAKVDRLNELTNETGGNSINIDSKGLVKQPQNTTAIQSPDGKLAYTTTEKAKEANEKISNINNTTNNLGINANVNVNGSNVNVNQNVKVAEAEKYPANLKLRNETIKEYTEMLEQIKSMNSDIKNNSETLTDIKDNVKKYFDTLQLTFNDISKIKDKVTGNNVVVVQNQKDNKTDADKEDEDDN